MTQLTSRPRINLILLSATLVLFNLLNNGLTSAQEEIPVPTSYNLTYEIGEDGVTSIKTEAKLYNPNQNVYISEYSVFLNYTDATDFNAQDIQGRLDPKIERRANGTLVSFKFNQRVVGTTKPLIFSYQYQTREVAQKSGLVWEVTLPKVLDGERLRGYSVSLSVPNAFGPQIYLSPSPSSVEKKLTKTIFKFSQESIAKSGAILSFGPYQIYSYNLKYHLKNPNLWKAQTKIALPPSIFGEQLTILDRITPLPLKVEKDTDGNFLATYPLNPAESLTVEVKGRAKIYNLSRNLEGAGAVSEIPTVLKNYYLSAQKYWEVGSPEVKKIVDDILAETEAQAKTDVIARKLFQKTVDLLKYDASRIKPDLKRLGASEALKKPDQAVCMEFADVYISLLRQAGIPAELIEGYASTTDASARPVIGDVLHSWVRLYLPKVGWIATDPTWANTTGGLDYFSRLDTNHFAFVIKGLSSETPYPAGAYKISPDQVGDIEVNVLGDKNDFAEPESVLSYEFKSIDSPSLFKGQTRLALVVKNEGKGYLFSVKYTPEGAASLNLGDIPPLGQGQSEVAVENPVSGRVLGRVSYLNAEGRVKSLEVTYNKSTDKKTPTNYPTLLVLLILSTFPALFLLGYLLYSRDRKGGLRR